ncbi:MAG: hypothetical protein NZ807_14030 [Dehalococcoidia bacterium]|nr:hypothetical protein [Dehalococcoidia bacterium]
MKLWNSQSGTELKTLEGHLGPVYSVAFSPDGKWIVSGSRDETLTIWPILSPTDHLRDAGQGV